MPRPQSCKELLTHLGMLNYLTKHIPNLCTKNKSLQDILKRSPFSWSHKNDQTLADLNQSIVRHVLLQLKELKFGAESQRFQP